MLVQTWMTKEPLCITPETTLSEAAMLMSRRKIRRLPVVRDQGAVVKTLLGIITLTDVARGYPPHLNPLSPSADRQGVDTPVEGIMTTSVISVAPTAALEHAAGLMCTRKIGALPVIRRDELAGIITESDIFRALATLLGRGGLRVTFDPRGERDPATAVVRLALQNRVKLISLVVTERMGVLRVTGDGAETFVEQLWEHKLPVIHVGEKSD